MWQNHFVWKGKTYYTGTVFVVREFKYPHGAYEKEATFIAYNPEYNKVEFQIGPQRHSRPLKSVNTWIVSATDKRDERVRCPTVKQKSDSEIDGLFVGWIWYIVLMAISTIFYDRIGLWILISVIFFTWRAKKIKEEGTYIEW